MNKILLVVILVLAVGAGLLYFKNNQSVMNQKPAPKAITPSQPVSASASVKEFTMTAKQWVFDPEVITVKQGDKVKINIKSLDVAHGFALPDFGVEQNLEPGKEIVVEFIASKKGEFTFSCSVMCGAGHREMTGKFIVE